MTVIEPDRATGVDFRLNGVPVTVRDDHPHLLAALREELDVTSPKDGCSPSGQCGCCTVLVDGRAVVACQQPLAKVAGRTITTLEGFDPDERQRFADAFAACGGLQCGFCIPGIIVRAKAQIDKKGPDLTRADMARHLGAHLCRCTGYVKVLDAIEAVAAGKEMVPERPGGIGTSGAKYEAAELALGDRGYVDDLRVPGCSTQRSAWLTTPAPMSTESISNRRGARPVWWRSSPRRTSRAICGSASSTPTGRS